MPVAIKRVYEAASDDDGYRVLVDRIWPRGVSKAAAHLDEWDKEVAPSTELREWFGHDPAKFDGFRERYLAELHGNPDIARLRELAESRTMTLVYSAHDEQHNQAVVLREALDGAI
ncbi:DUF488 domain-containing protein [Humibacter ginsenosidimutans]|uniref:DUF488 domain-containing protein n=1 Tax=Humibacter ginsenosidimutans TaxID=2599293 RepID=A0A5B8M0L2_9MICO|nr:DUF488 domain-containing protein [Humibacter ginsenosidimutans]QDZ13464.1 DUF488 domain-containing protein [Humibacter ginsenosidimutans]